MDKAAKTNRSSGGAPGNEPRPLDRDPGPTPDPSTTQWLNLISVEGKSVLWSGAEAYAAMVALRERGCNQVTFLGPPDEVAAQQGTICVQYASDVKKNSVDVAFVELGESPKEHYPRAGPSAHIADIGNTLKDDGIIVVALHRGLSLAATRLMALRALSRAGFRHRQYFLEDSRPRYHRAIVPYSDDPEWAIRYLTVPSVRDRSSVLGRLKRTIKTIVYRTTGRLNPRYTLLVIARKTQNGRARGTPSVVERTRSIASSMLDNSTRTPPVVLWSRPYSGKQYVFSYSPRDQTPLVIGQVSTQAHDAGGLSRQSYKNLQLLSPLAGAFAEMGITIPILLDSQETGPMTYYVRSSLSGEDIDDAIQEAVRRDDRIKLTGLIGEVMNLQAMVQDELTANLRDHVSRIEDCYFENYLNLPLEDYSPLARVGASLVQHGDFAPVNILRGAQSGQWGLIDWEWMRSSYPPLYDVFTFSLRVHYIEHRRKTLTNQQELANSVVDSFFSSNWFSHLVRDQAFRYCDRYKIPHQDIFNHFIRFLLFQCGRYRYTIAGHPETLATFEEILKWSISQRERFVCQ